DVHTLLRLPTGIWYSPGVKANVLFFDKRVSGRRPATRALWVYDLRQEQKFSLRQRPIAQDDLDDFVRCYRSDNRSRRKETNLFRRVEYSEIMKRSKANLDIRWAPEDRAGEPERPRELMRQILADLEEAMTEFAAAESELEQ